MVRGALASKAAGRAQPSIMVHARQKMRWAQGPGLLRRETARVRSGLPRHARPATLTTLKTVALPRWGGDQPTVKWLSARSSSLGASRGVRPGAVRALSRAASRSNQNAVAGAASPRPRILPGCALAPAHAQVYPVRRARVRPAWGAGGERAALAAVQMQSRADRAAVARRSGKEMAAAALATPASGQGPRRPPLRRAGQSASRVGTMAAALGAQASDATLGEEQESDLSAKLPSTELGFRPLRLPDEAAEFFGDLALDEDMATLEILPGEGDAVEALRCHASVLALRSTEIMHELLLSEEPPTPDEPLVLEVSCRRCRDCAPLAACPPTSRGEGWGGGRGARLRPGRASVPGRSLVAARSWKMLPLAAASLLETAPAPGRLPHP